MVVCVWEGWWWNFFFYQYTLTMRFVLRHTSVVESLASEGHFWLAPNHFTPRTPVALVGRWRTLGEGPSRYWNTVRASKVRIVAPQASDVGTSEEQMQMSCDGDGAWTVTDIVVSWHTLQCLVPPPDHSTLQTMLPDHLFGDKGQTSTLPLPRRHKMSGDFQIFLARSAHFRPWSRYIQCWVTSLCRVRRVCFEKKKQTNLFFFQGNLFLFPERKPNLICSCYFSEWNLVSFWPKSAFIGFLVNKRILHKS